MAVGNRIKARRMELGMTQDDLAKKLGYKSKSSITHLEKDRDIPRPMVIKLAQVLDTTPAYLMGWEDKKKSDLLELKEAELLLMIHLLEKYEKGFIEEMLTLPPEKEEELRQFVEFLNSKK